ncbi:hypothetical protein BGZ97_002878 [Linnemannia gamsii]|uniref:C2H2-type domain-containing protein n=1 Tax=Linnemannia gamsii TaxID=64522 RepID=A0A9P6UI26_9FUNG|nr:hypothetical protein BGZ97_002878 [Linnemannia gamsii]
MNINPFSLEGYLYTPLSNADILDNLSSWPSFDGTGGLDGPPLPGNKHQLQQQQQGAFRLLAKNKHGHQVHPFNTIYTADSLSPPFNPTICSANSSANSSPPRSDYASSTGTFANFDSCYVNDIHDPNDNKDIQGSFDFNDLLLNHSATSSKINNSNDIESTKKNDMEFLTTTYITKSAAALNVSNISPLSIHPCLTMSRSSSFTSAVSYIDPSLLTQKNSNSNNEATTSGCLAELPFSAPQARCLSTLSNGGLESEDDSYATMRTMFENSLRMGSPVFGSYSPEQFESQPPPPPISPFSVAIAAAAPAISPLTSQDIYMADGSVIRFDGTTFRPVPTTDSTTTTTTIMNNGQISLGLMGTVDPTLSSPPSKITNPYPQTVAAGSTDVTPVCYDTSSWDSFSHSHTHTHHQRVPMMNDSFKTYNKSPYHRHLPLKSAATTADSATFAAALLTPQSSGRRGSADSVFSTASGYSSRRSNRLVMGSHSRHDSGTSIKDFDERNHHHKRYSAASPSSLSSSSPPMSSPLSTLTSEPSSTGSPSTPLSSPSSSSSAAASPTKYRKDKNGDFQCPYAGCDYRYNLKREFNRHRNVHVFAGKDKYRCMNCGSGLCRLDSVKRHMEAKGKAECLRKGFYEEFHESGQYSLIRKCKATWYEAAAVARATSAASLTSKDKKI